MFEKAVRLKLRFNHKGLCTVEDLWDLPLKSLDSIFKKLNAEMKTQKEESLLETKSAEDAILDLKVAIIMHIVRVKLQERKAREEKKEKAAKKEKLLAIIAEKQDEAYRGMSIEDLTNLVNGL